MSSNFLKVYSHYFKNYYRSRSFYIILIITILASLITSYLTFKYSGRIGNLLPTRLSVLSKVNEESLILYLWAYIMSSLPVFSSVFFSSPAISSEMENRTAFYIFTQPVDRIVLVLGKYMAAVTASIVSILVYIFAELVSAIAVFGFVETDPFLLSLFMLILFIFAISAFSFLFSSLFDKNMYAYISTFVTYFIIFYSVNIALSLVYSYNAFFLLNNASTIIERVYININPTLFVSNFSLNPAGIHEVFLSSTVFIIYTIASLLLTFLVVERKEVK
jgi:ABC-2 type transport system permease protein